MCGFPLAASMVLAQGAGPHSENPLLSAATSPLFCTNTRPWAAAIREAVVSRKMPPWLADPTVGHRSNDPRLSDVEIQTIGAWAASPKREGDPNDMPHVPAFPDGWKIGKPDAVFSIPVHTLAGKGPDEYTYVKVPTNFSGGPLDRCCRTPPRKSQDCPSCPRLVEGTNGEQEKTTTPATEYAKWIRIRQGSLEWVRPDAPVIDNGCSVDDNGLFPGSKSSDLSSLISSYLPGREADVYPAGTARKIPAGAVLNLQIHYSRSTGRTETDDTSVGLIMAKEPPERVSR